MGSPALKGDKRPKKPIETMVRTRDLETLLHLDKCEMKHLEAISQVVRLWGQTDMQSRDLKNATLRGLRQTLGDERVNKILDRVEELKGQK